MDSQAPHDAVEEWINQNNVFGDNATVRREVTYGNSRFDFCIESGDSTAFLEVKGVTLEKDGLALFPDAPTLRGVKHIEELISCAREGFGAYIIFVVQMKGVTALSPNDAMHPQFGDALRRAQKAGVNILAYDCLVDTHGFTIDAPIPVIL